MSARTLTCGLIVGLGGALWAGPAPAQTSQQAWRQLDWCSGRFDPNFAPALDERGRIYLLLRDYDGLIANFTALVRLDPKDDEALAFRGHAYSEKGDLDRALADFDAALRLGPGDMTAGGIYRDRASAYRTKGDAARAAADEAQAKRHGW
jgi:tetratricopeptide (TPR) repeat protein